MPRQMLQHFDEITCSYQDTPKKRVQADTVPLAAVAAASIALAPSARTSCRARVCGTQHVSFRQYAMKSSLATTPSSIC